jgi:hypothetical protein
MRPVNKLKPEDCGTDDFVIKKTKVYLFSTVLINSKHWLVRIFHYGQRRVG